MTETKFSTKNNVKIALLLLAFISATFIIYKVYTSASLSINANPLERHKQGTFSALEILKAPPSIKEHKFLDENGNSINLSTIKGRVKIVNIWATWCPPCVREMPELAEIAVKYKAQGIVMIPINIDKLEKSLEAKKQLEKLSNGKLQFYSDPEMAIPFPLLVKGFPTTIFYDENNIEILRIGGAPNWKSKEADDLIFEVLKQSNQK
ncbi:MAG: TlpA family protein disulfide reductase [Caulobacterales bacterium]|nr:TlpA family protein disulfide reductase [Caulobacterales bacterium]